MTANKNTPFSPEIRNKIANARMVGKQPYHKTLVPEFNNIFALVKKRAQQYPDKPYLIFYNGTEKEVITYVDFFKHACQLASYFTNTLKLEKGQSVATLATNHARSVMVYYAAWFAGLVVVPLNTGESDERLLFSCDNAEVSAIFAGPDFLARAQTIKDKLGCEIIQLHGESKNTYPQFDEILTHHTPAEPLVEVHQTDSALLVYTSGTTGKPKGVVLEQRQLFVDAKYISQWHGMSADDVVMLVLPIHHVNGTVVTLFTPMFTGAAVVLNAKFSASQYWQVVAKEKCTWGSVVPTVLSFLLEADKSTRKPVDNYYLICGAGPLTVQTAKRFENTFNVPIMHGYGLSETTCYSCFIPHNLSKAEHEMWLYDYGYPTIGVAMPCNDMAIHDPQGQEVLEDVRGEIVIRGQNVMRCYYKRPEANEDAFTHGWFRTGDEGFYKTDSCGRKYFFITGRLKELIIRGGVNYAPLEIDEALSAIEGVKAGMAVGFQHNMYGEEVGAYVVLENGVSLSAEDILKQCQHLPFGKRPKVVVFGEEFPVTSTGKYQRLKLKPLFEKWQDTCFTDNNKKSK